MHRPRRSALVAIAIVVALIAEAVPTSARISPSSYSLGDQSFALAADGVHVGGDWNGS